jgi:hypothetical protein
LRIDRASTPLGHSSDRDLRGAALLAALLVEGIYGATGKPVLISAGSRSGHVVVTFSLRGAVAGSFVAATSPRTDISGPLTSGVKLQERSESAPPLRDNATRVVAYDAAGHVIAVQTIRG